MNAHALMLIPTVSNYIVNIYLLGVGLFLIVVALAIGCYVLKCLTKAYDAACNRLEYRLRMRRERLCALVHPSPATVNVVSANRATVLPYKARHTVDAREALRRSSYQGDE